MAIAQLRQGDAEQACSTFEGVLALVAGTRMSGRLGESAHEFIAGLRVVDVGRMAGVVERMTEIGVRR
ncbi:hypothetical protein [Yinghuangia soli]|uniref:Uncharacterized protein n=1 Tax=Yinghuangia soli TaxID=2908204 RepID=A0AA41Q3L1_9ACTN|nr:hypothetical protein [Yinghuangia soli]MCF2530360.1 hypothetical protein [Yinghuangia soli]